ncbi:MAG: PEP-utilizing enzyme [Desulfobulbaceae bacterium]|nr:PEP-utilizing enzyme [Desulfobulbaceae bacterium]
MFHLSLGRKTTGKKIVDSATPLARFRRILECNNRIMERVARMEQALGGEYVFDQAFLNSSLEELSSLVREVIYCLNALTDHSFNSLYPVFTDIADHLADLVAGGPGHFDRFLVLPYRLVNRDLDYLVGGKNAVLGEVGNQLNIHVPDGFVFTTAAYRCCLAENNLGERIDAILKGTETNGEKEFAIRELFDGFSFPSELVAVVKEQLVELRERQPTTRELAVRSSAVGEDGVRSFAGQFLSVLHVKPKTSKVLEAYGRVLVSRFSSKVLDYLGSEITADEYPMAVGVQTMAEAKAAGVLYTVDPATPSAETMVISAVTGHGAGVVNGTTISDSYVLDRHSPFKLLESDIVTESRTKPLADGLNSTDFYHNGMRRGSAMLSLDQLRLLAETALVLEKSFEGPLDIEWAMNDHGITLLQSRPLKLPVRPPPQPAEIVEALRRAEVLMHGRGQVVQLGVAAGPVVHVDRDTDPDSFPVGGIAVARHSSPRFSPIVRKAAAILTDVGSPTGHLATIAREYHTPALFGTQLATSILTSGEEITVDVEAREVYRGRLDLLVRTESAREGVYLYSNELRVLRRLLRKIAPLNLIDPSSSGFVPENCRTLHDIIRFSHEKAVEGLIDLHGESKAAMESYTSRPLEASIPINIRIIDLDPDKDQKGKASQPITPQEVRSLPFKALLSGLLRGDAWAKDSEPFGIKDLMSSFSRPLSQLVNPPAYAGVNLAIVAHDYCNLSLRLGYHFNVIDAFLSEEAEDNYIYFRFVGGFAEDDKRRRRAELIGLILASLHFRVEQRGDLLTAKAKMLDGSEMEYILNRLGELVAFTRQLDVRMTDETAVNQFFNQFLEKYGHSAREEVSDV